MMLKVNEQYFNVDVDVEKQSRAFDSFGKTSGDFSYEFILPDTGVVRKALGVESFHQINKRIYRELPADVLTDDAIPLFHGTLKVVSKQNNIVCNFFSGNSNWIKQLTGSIIDFDYSAYDLQRDDAAVVSTWNPSNTGVVFPLVDRGNLENRLGAALANNTDDLNAAAFDFHPFFFVKTIFKMIFDEIYIKVVGDLINDSIFQNMIISSNSMESRSDRVDERTAKVGRTSSQLIGTSQTFLNMQEIEDGSKNLWDDSLKRYVSDSQMRVTFTLDLQMSVDQEYVFEIYKNGVVARTVNFADDASIKTFLDADPGDYFDFYLTASGSPANLLTGSSIVIQPSIFATIFISDYLPDLTKSEFVSSIFKQLNIVCSYDDVTKTLYTKSFNNIKNTEIDISQYVSSWYTDYTEFINDFAKKNNFTYQQPDNTDNNGYNEANEIPQGNGVVTVDNDYLEESKDVIELSFASVFTYKNTGFNTPLAKLNFVTYSRISDTEFDITSVTDNGSGIARFNVPGAMPLGLLVGRVVELFNSSSAIYEGTGVLAVVTGTYFELVNVPFVNDATIKFNLVLYEQVEDKSPIVLINTFADISDFSTIPAIYVGGLPYTTNIPYAFFDKPRTGLPIDSMIYSLAFDPVNQVDSYQIGLIDRGYSDLQRVLQDPIKIYADVNLPVNIFLTITMLESIRLKTSEFNSKFFINRISGYKGSHVKCIFELIKL